VSCTCSLAKIDTLSKDLAVFAADSVERRRQVNYLDDVATRAIFRTRQVLHHGMGNQKKVLVHGDYFEDGDPDGAYRIKMYLDNKPVDFDSLPWFEQLRLLAAAGVVNKGGACGAFSRVLFMWCLMNARCRVTRVKPPGLDHTWIVLSLGDVHVVVDAWQRQPVVCFPKECDKKLGMFFISDGFSSFAGHFNLYTVDVLEPRRDALDSAYGPAQTRRKDMSKRPVPPGGQPPDDLYQKHSQMKGNINQGNWDFETNFMPNGRTQLGRPTVDGQPVYAVLPNTAELRGSGMHRL
jgi:hypothetical protein